MSQNILSENDLNLLVRMIIHDMDAPLTVINRILSRMQIGRFDLTNETHMRMVKSSAMALDRVQGMLRDLQEVVSSRRMSVKSKTCTIKGLTETIAEQFIPVAQSEGHRFNASYNNNVKVCTDPDIVQRVGFNFLMNALYHTDSGQPIILEINANQKGGFCLTVTNYGTSIPEEYIQNIFQPGVQLELKNNRKWKGHGLGLAFCRMAADLLGGNIKAENLEGNKGVKFSFDVAESLECKDNAIS